MGCGCEFCGGARSRFAPGEDQPCVSQWNQLEWLIAEIPERQMEYEKLKEVVARLEEARRKPGKSGCTPAQS